jgi:pyruvate formate-lyase activating enzyme-like uncharacterized protein
MDIEKIKERMRKRKENEKIVYKDFNQGMLTVKNVPYKTLEPIMVDGVEHEELYIPSNVMYNISLLFQFMMEKRLLVIAYEHHKRLER